MKVLVRLRRMVPQFAFVVVETDEKPCSNGHFHDMENMLEEVYQECEGAADWEDDDNNQPEECEHEIEAVNLSELENDLDLQLKAPDFSFIEKAPADDNAAREATREMLANRR
jgi:C4-type Zn-finger protein